MKITHYYTALYGHYLSPFSVHLFPKNIKICSFVILGIIKMEKKEERHDKPQKKLIRHGNGNQKHDVNAIVDQLKQKGNICLTTMRKIIRQASKILEKEPTLLKLTSPMVIVGDIHGQFFDLLNIFQKFGDPSHVHYLFLGDYVDRGKFCIEVMTLVLALKINYPNNIHLLRGNHEGRVMTTFYNFKTQCQKKYNSGVYEEFVDLFMNLPLSAVVDEKYFVVHGGISPKFKSLTDIVKINRFVEIPDHGPLCDMLWSDPTDDSHENWVNNKMRSCSYFYSRIQATKFLQGNNIKMIIRGHQVQMKGFKYQYDVNQQPLTLTIFSAPKYCDTFNNKGAIAIIKGNHLQTKCFKGVQHPFVMNNYLNAFEISMPTLTLGINKVFSHILKLQKVKKSIGEEDDVKEILRKLESVHQVNAELKINADEINFFLNQVKATQRHKEISFGLLELIQQSSLNQKLPIIFGPKSQFIKIQIANHQPDPTLETEIE